MSLTFNQKLNNIIQKNNSLVCVGLDSDFEKLPKHVRKEDNSIFRFNKAIIDQTYDLVCAYKPNTAFYEKYGDWGLNQLKMTMDYLRDNYPEIVTIIDAKRADIGNTNEGYAGFVFDYLGGDSITLHPYLGGESLKPFLDKTDKGCIILAKTSNPDSAEFQNLEFEGKPFYQKVVQNFVEKWNYNNNLSFVVGATYPVELKQVRKIVGDSVNILVPGIGKQGGDLEGTLKAGLTEDKKGLMINSSRGIIFASNGEDFAEKAREEALKLKESINSFR